MEKTRITVAKGDGIGPEIMDATLNVLKAAGAPLEYDEIEIGEAVYLKGVPSGIPDDAWDTLRRNKIFLKSPITTPQGKGYKSVNVTIRTSLNLYANVRPCKAYTPYVTSAHPGMDLVIIRENEEDLYTGIEHRQTNEVTQVLKLITRPGSERIIRYAFEYARAYGRKKVTCMSKDNIMKITDGLFHRVFDEVAAEYPDIQNEHNIVDIGAARLAAQPERMDVIVTLNLYGDILSDIAAQVAGSVGLAGSANIGSQAAMFEAVHGSAPDIANRSIANPSGLIVASTQMLVHLGMPEHAQAIYNALLCTLEDGIHTSDIYRDGLSEREVGTRKFADAVIQRLGKTPQQLQAVQYKGKGINVAVKKSPASVKSLNGVDVFLDWDEDNRDPNVLGKKLAGLGGGLALTMISNRGVKVYPDGLPETYCTDHWRCRFTGATNYAEILSLMNRIHDAGLNIIKSENLYTFDGEVGYSLGQGE